MNQPKMLANMLACVGIASILGGCAAIQDTDKWHADQRVTRVLAMSDCELTYVWTDQAYAFAPMVGANCAVGEHTIRIRLYQDGTAAALGLSDEVAILQPGASVLAGEDWFLISPPELVSPFLSEFPALTTLSDPTIRALQENPPSGDQRDMCVVAMASIITSFADGNVDEAHNIATGYRGMFSDAVVAAEKAASDLVDGGGQRLEAFKSKNLDPYMHDVTLASIISPLKHHCSRAVADPGSTDQRSHE